MTKLSKFRLSLASRQVTWVIFFFKYFNEQLVIWKGATARLKIVAAVSEQNISQASYFENCLFRIKQLTI